jgi:hypothetical protein
MPLAAVDAPALLVAPPLVALVPLLLVVAPLEPLHPLRLAALPATLAREPSVEAL